jgi:hypothetical protein
MAMTLDLTAQGPGRKSGRSRFPWDNRSCQDGSALTAGMLQPFVPDQSIPKEKITALDRRYTAVIQALDDLVDAVGLKAA